MKFAVKKTAKTAGKKATTAGKAKANKPGAAGSVKKNVLSLAEKKKTFNAGADEERSKIKKHLLKSAKDAKKFSSPVAVTLINEAIAFIDSRVKRNKGKSGGL